MQPGEARKWLVGGFFAVLGHFSGESRRHGISPRAAEGLFSEGNAGFGSSPKRFGLPNSSSHHLIFTALQANGQKSVTLAVPRRGHSRGTKGTQFGAQCFARFAFL
jgi:hypothetical protein